MERGQIQAVLDWVERYRDTSPDRILLGSNPIPEELRGAVATQVRLAPIFKRKNPVWFEQGVYLPASINLEQSSSWETASYKAGFSAGASSLMDLTGGLGVDFVCMSRGLSHAIYLEQDKELFEASQFNLPRLSGANRLKLLNVDSMSHLNELIAEHAPELVYVDPARRSGEEKEKRVVAIEDSHPNLIELVNSLLSLSQEARPRRLVAKLSPMLDVRHVLSLFDCVRALHIVAVRGEVKELLLDMDLMLTSPIPSEKVDILAVNLLSSLGKDVFASTFRQESLASTLSYTPPLQYLYEPNGAIMKSGLFRSLGANYNLPALHPNSHLYTSDDWIADFPGRIFSLIEVIPFRSSLLKRLRAKIPRAMITCRNFPLKPDALRKKLGIEDAGDTLLIGTTLLEGEHVLLHCRQAKAHAQIDKS